MNSTTKDLLISALGAIALIVIAFVGMLAYDWAVAP